MERHSIRNTAIALGLTTVLAAGGAIIRPDQHIMGVEDYTLREKILSSYNFNYQAIAYLNQIPFFNRNTTTNGGGMSYDMPLWGRWVEVYSMQPEAALHEMSETYFRHLRDQDPNFSHYFMEAVVDVATHDDTLGYYHQLMYGIPDSDFKGIDLSDDVEYWGSISSRNMGNVYGMPNELKPFYAKEFVWYDFKDPLWKPQDQTKIIKQEPKVTK